MVNTGDDRRGCDIMHENSSTSGHFLSLMHVALHSTRTTPLLNLLGGTTPAIHTLSSAKGEGRSHKVSRCCTIWKEETNAGPNALNEGRVRSTGKGCPPFSSSFRYKSICPSPRCIVSIFVLHSLTMLFQPCRLSSLLFLVSTTILTFANIASAQYSTADPTATSAAAATPSPLPTSDAFYLVVADTGTPFDGDYLYFGEAFSGDGLFVLLFGKAPALGGGSVFHLSNGSYGALTSDPSGYVATYYDLYGALLFQDPDPAVLEANGETPASCELSDGVILCQNTEYAGFYTFPSTDVDGGSTVPYLELGPAPIPTGAVSIRLLPVPVE